MASVAPGTSKALLMLPPASTPRRDPLAFKLPSAKRASTVPRVMSVPAAKRILPPPLAMRALAFMLSAPAAACRSTLPRPETMLPAPRVMPCAARMRRAPWATLTRVPALIATDPPVPASSSRFWLLVTWPSTFKLPALVRSTAEPAVRPSRLRVLSLSTATSPVVLRVSLLAEVSIASPPRPSAPTARASSFIVAPARSAAASP